MQQVETAGSTSSCALPADRGPFLVFAAEGPAPQPRLTANLCGGTRTGAAAELAQPAFGPGWPPLPGQATAAGSPSDLPWIAPLAALVALMVACLARLIMRRAPRGRSRSR
ncbi:hypothetical protein ABZ863_04960 [Saccharomonospora sp. NPDC046836]|uniref:hypothetical protein n=1 Tax=Saccharomonospora sp. NPDC046836 TaxID=3156921 RepID=UPI0033FF4773